MAQAQKQFEEAVALDAASAEAHAGLARALEAANDITGARVEAEKALGIRIFVDPLLFSRVSICETSNRRRCPDVDRH